MLFVKAGHNLLPLRDASLEALVLKPLRWCGFCIEAQREWWFHMGDGGHLHTEANQVTDHPL